MDHGKMERLLPMMLLLSGTRRYSIEELASRFEISERTVFRYLETYERSGFVLDKENGYRLHTETPSFKSFQKLLHFSEDEAHILYQTLAQIEGSSPIKERLLRKLNVLYDFHVLEHQTPDALAMIRQVRQAMERKQQLCFVAYRSSNSDSVADRVIEPFAFLPNYEAVWAIEVASGQCKQFRLSRIGCVKETAHPWTYEPKHCIPFCDAFRMSSETPIANVEARLSLKAYNLLIEEHPQSREYVVEDAGQFLLNIPVASFAGVGRFVLGLPGEIRVMVPEEFKSYLQEEIEKLFFS